MSRESALATLPAAPIDVRVRPAPRRRIATAVLAALAVGYVLLHIATLVRSRQVWFDETFFASIADSLQQTGTLRLTVSPLWLDGPVYLYGPVYFLIVAPFFALLGIGPAQNRLPGLLFGFAVLGIVFAILRQAAVRRRLALLITALLALDPTFHQSIHSGRTDTTAMFFFLSSFFCLLRSRDRADWAGLGWVTASGLLGAVGVLTTPRPGYMLLPMAVILAARWVRRPERATAAHLLAWGAAFTALYGPWILYAFGGIRPMLAYYGELAGTYAGGNRVRMVHVPVLAAVAVLAAVLLRRAPRKVINEVTIFAIPSIIGFYLLVRSAPSFGALYTFLMVPPAYLAVGVLAEAAREAAGARGWRRGAVAAVLGMLAVVNGAAFVTRSALELVEWQRRDPAQSEAAIAAVIPSGSRVVGDDRFYFIVRRGGSDFQYAERGGTLEERVAYHRDVYRFEYLVTSQEDDAPMVQGYRSAVPLRLVAEVPAPPTTPLAERIVAIGRALGLSHSLLSGYEGRVFARAN